MDLRTLQCALGGEISGQQLNCPGPGHGPKDRSLCIRLADKNTGYVFHSFACDDFKACDDYIRGKLGLPPWEPGDDWDRHVPTSGLRAFDQAAVDREAERRERSEEDVEGIKRAIRIWNGGRDPRGTLAEIYLASRALKLPDDLPGKVLRFHPRCPWRDENIGATIFIPALIAAFRSVDDDAVTAVHRIALNADGSKLGRRMRGLMHRVAVKLDPIGETLHIGEGVETCLAARQMGRAPAWALGTVGAISFFPVLPDVQRLVILGEAGEASERAVRTCSRRWRAAGRKVVLVMPDEGFSDLNDELMAKVA